MTGSQPEPAAAADVRDSRYARPGSEPGLTYDCADDGLFCELATIDGVTTCTECGDRPAPAGPLHAGEAV